MPTPLSLAGAANVNQLINASYRVTSIDFSPLRARAELGLDVLACQPSGPLTADANQTM